MIKNLLMACYLLNALFSFGQEIPTVNTNNTNVSITNNQMQQASKKIVEFITKFEGFESKPYLDIAGVPTIGYGATYYQDGRKVTMKDAPITKACALDLKMFHLKQTENAVKNLVKSKVNQNQFDALVSFTYNLGEGNLKSSTLLKKVNANPNDKSIEKEFLKWVNTRNPKTGKLEPSFGLTRRRNEEAVYYFS